MGQLVAIATNNIQRDIRFLGTDPHKLKEEFPVISDRMHQQILTVREAIGVGLT